jgi:NAD(P)H dehydrogenase (quinone)
MSSPKLLVTGASGHLGRLVLTSLLQRVPAAQIIATVRDTTKASDLAALGIELRQADYTQPETLATAFAGITRLLLISSNDIGPARIAQHKAAIDAAKTAGAELLAYTSVLRADTSTLPLAADHLATEQHLAASSVPYTFLRNSWYFENYTGWLGAALQHGAILGSSGEGHIAAAARADYAEAAAVVLSTPGHAGKIYELAGDIPFTLPELAAEVSKQSGKTVVYNNLPEQAYAAALQGFGLPAQVATMLAACDVSASHGALDSTSRDLSTLIGHHTTTLAAAIAAALSRT